MKRAEDRRKISGKRIKKDIINLVIVERKIRGSEGIGIRENVDESMGVKVQEDTIHSDVKSSEVIKKAKLITDEDINHNDSRNPIEDTNSHQMNKQKTKRLN